MMPSIDPPLRRAEARRGLRSFLISKAFKAVKDAKAKLLNIA